SEILAEEDLEILIDLGVKGGEGAKYWTCDFSHVSGSGRFVWKLAESVSRFRNMCRSTRIIDHRYSKEWWIQRSARPSPSKMW
nr:hypothetical protein [Tanacetum cinerariifolium]